MPSSSEQRTRNLWPLGLIAAFTVFLAGTVGLVVFSTTQRVDLVTPGYYEQELRFQQQLDRTARTRGLGSAVVATFDAQRRELQISLPLTPGATEASGSIGLYRPDAPALDRKVHLQVDSQGRQTIDAREWRPGLWRLRLTWVAGGQEFFWEDRLVVPAQAG